MHMSGGEDEGKEDEGYGVKVPKVWASVVHRERSRKGTATVGFVSNESNGTEGSVGAGAVRSQACS
jgi:hypothetical protein